MKLFNLSGGPLVHSLLKQIFYSDSSCSSSFCFNFCFFAGGALAVISLSLELLAADRIFGDFLVNFSNSSSVSVILC